MLQCVQQVRGPGLSTSRWCPLRPGRASLATSPYSRRILINFKIIKWYNLPHMSLELNKKKARLHEIIFESNTVGGKIFDIALLVCILLSIMVVMLDSVPSFHLRFGRLFYFKIGRASCRERV